MEKRLELPRLVREVQTCTLEIRKEDGKTKLSLSASSEYPVDRWGMTEVLSHDPGDVRLDRAKGGSMPVLFNHNWDDPIGMVSGAKVADGRLHLEATLFDTARAKEILAMVEGGLRNVSIGYQIHVVEEDIKKALYTATDWEPYEVSIVTVPADPTVGVGREAAGAKFEVRVLRPTVKRETESSCPNCGEKSANVSIDCRQCSKTSRMEQGTNACPECGQVGESSDYCCDRCEPDRGKSTPAKTGKQHTEARIKRASSFSADAATTKAQRSNSMLKDSQAADTSGDASVEAAQAAATAATMAQQSRSAVDLEIARKRGIENLCKANNIDDRIKARWVTSGMSIDAVAEDLLKIVEERGKNNPQSSAHLDLSQKEVKNFSLLRAIHAVSTRDWSKAGFEAECSREIGTRLGRAEDPMKFFVPLDVQRDSRISQQALQARDAMRGQRDIFVGTASAGGYLVSTVNMSFIEVLRNRTVAIRMGARELTGLQGNVTIPKQLTGATAAFLGTEATQATESQPTFGQLALSPKNAAAYTEISRQLLLQGSPDAEGIVNADLAAVMGIAVDNSVINGSGSSGQPLGIIATPGIASVTATSLDYGKTLDFQLALANANVVPVNGGYVTTPSVAKIFMTRQRFTSTDTPLWVGNLWDGEVQGFRAMSSLQIPTANALFGDWAQVILAQWGILEIEVNPYANFQAGIIGVRAFMSLDVGLRYAAAMALSTNVT